MVMPAPACDDEPGPATEQLRPGPCTARPITCREDISWTRISAWTQNHRRGSEWPRCCGSSRWPRQRGAIWASWAGGSTGLTASCAPARSEEHTSELQSRGHLVCRLLLEKKKRHII